MGIKKPLAGRMVLKGNTVEVVLMTAYRLPLYCQSMSDNTHRLIIPFMAFCTKHGATAAEVWTPAGYKFSCKCVEIYRAAELLAEVDQAAIENIIDNMRHTD